VETGAVLRRECVRIAPDPHPRAGVKEQTVAVLGRECARIAPDLNPRA
jgi:hypothetical protein